MNARSGFPWLPSLPPDDGWMIRGACRTAGIPMSSFFPSLGDSLDEALQVCKGCEVKPECLQFALRHGLAGVWGGTSERSRRRMRARAA